ncbi:MAG: tetratricopeptide repeat protein, partial [Myxococcota bacterium]
GRSTISPPDRPRILIVDWAPEDRGDLEVAMKTGVAVVAYDGAQLKLLDCQAKGEYGFVGTTRRQHVVRLENRDELAANLPLQGLSIAAKLEGEFARGATLDVALVMVGKRTTTARRTYGDQLEGSCQRATHFVRGATVGAFSMSTGTRAKLRSAAEMFGIGASAASSSEAGVESQQGQFEACQRSTPAGSAPPPECGSPLRLELAPILDAAPAAASAPPKEDSSPQCPTGFVLRDEKCSPLAGSDVPKVCRWDRPDECEARCSQGSAGSCFNLGAAYERGVGVSRDARQAFGGYERACRRGDIRGCRAMAAFYIRGIGVTKDYGRALTLLQPACLEGDALSCSNLGTMYAKGFGVAEDLRRATSLYGRACDAGNPRGCVNLGQAYRAGDGVPVDYDAAHRLFTRACRAEHPAGCFNLGRAYDEGQGVAQDHDRARELFHQACDLGYEATCVDLGIRYDKGIHGPVDAARAAELFAQACQTRFLRGCANLGLMYLEGRGVNQDAKRAAQLFEQTCTDGFGCDTLGELYAKGLGVPKDPARARQILTQACENKDQRSCALKDKLGL